MSNFKDAHSQSFYNKDSIESIFIVYANHPLKDDPRNFQKVLREIKNCLCLSSNEKMSSRKGVAQEICRNTNLLGIAKNIVDRIVMLAEADDLKEVDKIDKEFPRNKGFFAWMQGLGPRIAAEAVYGYRDGYCQTNCIYNADRWEVLGEDYFGGHRQVKCYECEQLFFLSILSQIVKGTEYKDIFGFANFLGHDRYQIRCKIDLMPAIQKSPFKYAVKEYQILCLPDIQGLEVNEPPHDPLFPEKYRFNDFLTTIISFSLTKFLLNNDRKKLKLCQWCAKYFIAKKADLRTKYCPVCSPKSKMTQEERKKYMANRRKRERRKKESYISSMKEEYISRLIEKFGFTEEEAEEEWEQDKTEYRL